MQYTEDSGQASGETPAAPNQSVAKDDHDMANPQSKRSPAFQFYPTDFFSSRKVDDMSMTERGIYITFLGRQWLDGGLPIELHALARIARMKAPQFERMWNRGPLHECFVERGGRLVNLRLERERAKQNEYRRKQKERADMRWHSTGTADVHSEGNASRSLSSSSSSISSSKEQEISAEPLRDSTPVVLTFTTVGKFPTFALTEGQMARWRESYPNLDVDGECRRASEWIAANPERRKTAKGMPAFLVGWLNRATDRGGRSPSVSTSRLPAWAQKAKAVQ